MTSYRYRDSSVKRAILICLIEIHRMCCVNVKGDIATQLIELMDILSNMISYYTMKNNRLFALFDIQYRHTFILFRRSYVVKSFIVK